MLLSNTTLSGNIALALFLLLLLYSCIQDELWRNYESCRYFLLWGLGGIGILLFEIAGIISVGEAFRMGARRAILFFYLFFQSLATVGLVLWELEMVRERVRFAKESVAATGVLLLLLFTLLDALYAFQLPETADILAAHAASWHHTFTVIRNAGTAVLLLVLILCHTRKLGRDTAMLLLSALLIPAATMLLPKEVQTQWSKYVTILMLFLVYLSMWKTRSEEFTKQELLLLRKDTELMEKQAELARKEVELTNSRVSLMMSQIQPHFLYNTLSSIARLCTENPERARQVAMDFSTYFRENLNSLHSDKPIPFSQELAHTETYLNIELARFPDTLRVEYNICAEDFYLPALTLQPLAENAVKHGLCRKEGGGTLLIESFERDDAFEIHVIDDGVGFDVSEQSGEDEGHIGIRSVRQRLMSQCQGALIFKSQPGEGTRVTIYLPKEGVNA